MTLPVLASPPMDKLMAEQQKVANTIRFGTPMELTVKPEANRPRRLAKLRITSWELVRKVSRLQAGGNGIGRN